MDDLRAVADAAGIENATVIGLSEGGPLGILLASTYPERVRQLVLWGTYARVHVAHDYPIGVEPAVTAAFIDHLEEQWGSGVAWRTFISHLPEDEDTRLLIARYERQTTTPGVMKQVMLSNVSMDVREALPAVQFAGATGAFKFRQVNGKDGRPAGYDAVQTAIVMMTKGNQYVIQK